MKYTALIENRKSVRAFRNKAVSASDIAKVREYYEKECQKLFPDIETELLILGTKDREALEGSAGYQAFLVGAPHYLVLLSDEKPHAFENAGYIMEDLVLKLTEMGLDSCWLTFADGEKVKEALRLFSEFQVTALVAFGYGEKTIKKRRINILSMSNVDVEARRSYYSHKKNINELVFVDELGNSEGLEEWIGFYEDMLWQCFYAAAQAPSYLNRQPYAFVLKKHELILINLLDAYTNEVSAKLNLGIVLLHFNMVGYQWVGDIHWDMDSKTELELPEGCTVEAVYHM